MKLNQVAAQLYTLRDHLKTAPDIVSGLKKVRAIGYTAVQISGVGPIADDELVRICRGEGLTICATHEPGKTICEEPQQVVDHLARLGCIYTAYPYPHVPIETIAQVEALAKQLDHAGEVLRKAGQVLTYHNHALEFRKVAGRTVLDWLYDLTAPANLQGEPDTYWVQTGGGDPVWWCQRLSGRLPLLHMKDYAFGIDPKAPQDKPRAAIMAEVGTGCLDWKRICAAAAASGCQWYIVEQDVCPGDPFDSLKISFEWIRANLVG